jgi:secreted PhoX family phosphatase
MAGFSMHKPPYSEFGNNSLFYVPMAGDSAGLPLRIANAPVGAEFTGPWFQKDGKMLLLSVQHPGEDSPSFSDLKSHWPLGEREIPRSAVVQIHGPGLETLTGES